MTGLAARTHDRTVSQPRHSKDDALSEREFELLLEGARSLRDPYNEQTSFIVLVGGRLGLRPGEIAHMRGDWIDWRKRMIRIPRRQQCQKGRHGGICGYCRSQAKQMTNHNPELSVADAEAHMWQTKTDAAARAVPFDFDPRTELAVERFFDRYDDYPHSRQSVNRRVEKAAEAAPELDASSLYPHALRATAATYHAGRGLDVLPLQGFMGGRSRVLRSVTFSIRQRTRRGRCIRFTRGSPTTEFSFSPQEVNALVSV